MPASSSAIFLTRIRAPGAETIALLFFLEALSRGTASAVLPIDAARILGADENVSAAVLLASLIAIPITFAAPTIARAIGRPKLMTFAALGAIIAAVVFTFGFPEAVLVGFVLRAIGVALVTICLNLFILDYVRRGDLGRAEPLRMMFLGLGWIIGPLIGVATASYIHPSAPYWVSGGVMLVLLLLFWILRFREVAGVRPTKTRAFVNPLPHLHHFMRQPRLLHAWINSTARAFFWMSFFYYTPLYAVQTGLGPEIGGYLLSVGTLGMAAMPLWGAMTRHFGIRRMATWCFAAAALGCLSAWFFATDPWIGAAGIMAASLAMTMNDGYGNALFFRACRPSKRNELTPAFTTYRDVAEISQAAIFWVLLFLLPIEIVFLVLGAAMAALALLSRTIHPRL